MNTVAIALRNIARNKRRSLMTILAIAVSTSSLLLFGGFVQGIVYGLQTDIVHSDGHLHIYRQGYFVYGSGNPSRYSIGPYKEILTLIKTDPALKDLVLVATPWMAMNGIAGNFAQDASKTFFGRGIIPSDLKRMGQWNTYHIRPFSKDMTPLKDSDTEGGIIGQGLARMLFLCNELHVKNCTAKPAKTTPSPVADIMDLAQQEHLSHSQGSDKSQGSENPAPRIDLLAATAQGAPNVVSLYVVKAVTQGVREYDDSYVEMHFDLAQRLVYGRGEKMATAIVLQLARTSDIPAVKKRLMDLFHGKNFDLEIKDMFELVPYYGQVIAMFTSIFGFISVIMCIIVLFTIMNTMAMSVMERVNEIGTTRALGVRRSGILQLFIAEGGLLGGLGSAIGVLFSLIAAEAVNLSGLTWVPPGNVDPVYLTVLLYRNPALIPLVAVATALMAIVSSIIPARKAARLNIVDALGHV